ncbi:MAG: PilZ domain-containing protein [Deltaproteobacteria bacterium]|nr:MAG: PilZ domain-containing protein [Deltaproteobacteria bacterium]
MRWWTGSTLGAPRSYRGLLAVQSEDWLAKYQHLDQERRRDVRISPKGTVVLLAGGDTCRCRIVNLSHGGVLVTVPVEAGDMFVPGRSLELELQIDGKSSQWIRLSGRVVRIEATTIAMTFDKVSVEFIQLVDEMLGASYGRRRILSVISVDTDADRRARIAEAFRVVGCTVVTVSTPLEMIVRLGELQFEPDLIVIASSRPSATSDDLRRFVEREHPGARLAAVSDQLINPGGESQWLSSMDADGDLVNRVRRLLLPLV